MERRQQCECCHRLPTWSVIGDVLADSGVSIRHGYFSANGASAKGVLLGPPGFYAPCGLAGKGVTELLNLLECELRVAMTLTGLRQRHTVDGDALVR